LAQHLAIGEAVITGDPQAADHAAAEHVRFTHATIGKSASTNCGGRHLCGG